MEQQNVPFKSNTMCYFKQNKLYPSDKLGKLTRHHRRPRSQKGESSEKNISYVPQKLHEAYHLLFANNSVYRIVEILNEHWVDPDFKIVAIPKQ